MKSRLLNRPAGVGLALAVLLVPTAIGAMADSASAVPPAPQAWTVLVGNETSSMSVQGQRFLPGDVTIDAGDTVTWQANSTEIHTVTFIDGGAPQSPPPPFDPTNGAQLTPQGGPTMGAGYFNSGLLSTSDSSGPIPVPPVHSYTLTFPDPGTFTYYCLVHGVMMRGVVHVQPASTAYPYSQADVDADAAFQASAINADGRALLAQAHAASTNHKVFTGADDGIAMTMRFSKAKVVIHKGDTVRFLNTMSMGAPHTVTFGAVPAGLALFAPAGDPTNYRGKNLHSGIIGPGGKFKVTFNKVGRFHYVCALHQDMGMKGLVVVKP